VFRSEIYTTKVLLICHYFRLRHGKFILVYFQKQQIGTIKAK